MSVQIGHDEIRLLHEEMLVVAHCLRVVAKEHTHTNTIQSTDKRKNKLRQTVLERLSFSLV